MTIAVVMATGAFAHGTIKKVRLYKGNEVVAEQEYDEIDSIVFVDVPAGATIVDGVLMDGEFSVSTTTKVHFSQGNLQATYNGSAWTWSFATNQYDYIGDAAANNAINGNGSVSVNGIVDIFGWSTAATYYGINNSTSDSTYSGDFVDWGVNPISNGGNTANAWRTLSMEEWKYLFHSRAKADERCGLGSVNGVNGTILLPDDWTTVPAGLTFTSVKDMNLPWTENTYNCYCYWVNRNGKNFAQNTYTTQQWSAMEAYGAVFLPAAGCRDDVTFVGGVGLYGFYWSSSPYDEIYAYHMNSNSYYLFPQQKANRNFGHSVRLVH